MTSFTDNYSLLAPGPVQLHPEVRKALALPMIHHRTPEFDAILKRVLGKMKNLFQTTEPVYLLTATGSGGMEALLVNVLSPGDKVLCLVSGKFGERWAEMVQAFGAEALILNIPWGEAATAEAVAEALQKTPGIRAVLCQACETSTAVAHPLKDIAAVISSYPETLFLVDGITALGAYPLPMDAWAIDGLVAGSQKAFMLPTGMSFVSFSKKAQGFFDSAKCSRFYYDIRKEKKANSNGETFFSSNVALIRALDVVLDLILQEGLEKHFFRIHRRAEFTRIFAQKLGLSLYAQSPSDSVTALKLPIHLDGQKIRQYLEDTHAITIMGGQDQAKGKILRIGHMGFISDEEMLRLLESLGQTLFHFDSSFISLEKIHLIVTEAKQYLEQHL